MHDSKTVRRFTGKLMWPIAGLAMLLAVPASSVGRGPHVIYDDVDDTYWPQSIGGGGGGGGASSAPAPACRSTKEVEDGNPGDDSKLDSLDDDDNEVACLTKEDEKEDQDHSDKQ